MSNAEDVKAENKEADPNIVSIKVRGQVRMSGALGAFLVSSFLNEGTRFAWPGADPARGEAAPRGRQPAALVCLQS